MHNDITGDYNLSVSNTTFVVCVYFIYVWLDLWFKADSERQIFEKLFMTILFILPVFGKNLLRYSIFLYLEMFGLGFEPRPHV